MTWLWRVCGYLGWFLCWPVGALAMSLGPVQGQVWWGERLNVRIPLRLTAAEEQADVCLRLLPPLPPQESAGLHPLHIDIEALPAATTSGPQTHVLLVRSERAVQELEVHFGVAVGCASSVRRYYTLLVDLPPDAASTATASPSVGGATIAPPASPASHTPKITPTNTEPLSAAAAPPRPPTPMHQSKRASATRTPPSLLVLPQAQAGLSDGDTDALRPIRLKVDPVFASHLQAAGLMQVSDPQTLREFWDFLRLSFEDYHANQQTMQSLQAQLSHKDKEIQAIQTNNSLTSAQPTATQPLQADDWPDRSFVVVCVLLGMSWLLFIGLHFKPQITRRWAELRRTKPSSPRVDDEEEVDAVVANPPKKSSLFSAAHTPTTAAVQPTQQHVDLDALFDEATHPPPKHADASALEEFTDSALMSAASRAVAAEELFDLQQQVEFFIMLGHTHQAVEVLQQHIQDSNDPSPLAYLDLLKLQHDLGLKEAYETTRSRFNLLFNAGTPAFDNYIYSRRSLERYPAALSRIQHLWSSPLVLNLLEKTIFQQDPNEHAHEPSIFDLEAYRELLLLYGIAREIHATSIETASQQPHATGFEMSEFAQFAPTTLQPLKAVMETRVRPSPPSPSEPDFLLDTLVGIRHTAKEPEQVFSLEQSPDLQLDFSDLDALNDPNSPYVIKKTSQNS